MKRMSLIDSIVEEIKDKILSGELKDGDMLESQDDMSKRMGVSRPSLREALRRLELMGLIESKHGRGTFVKTVQPQDFMNPLSGFLTIDKESAFELLEARLFLEGSVAALAAQKATPDDVLAMEQVIAGMKAAAENFDVQKFIELDVQFHVYMAECTKNRVMIQVVNILRGLLQKLVARVFDRHQGRLAKTFAQTIDYHEKIYQAIKARDMVKARNAMESHINDVRQKVENGGDVFAETGKGADRK